MDKYNYYFFNEPWPEDYYFYKATTFTKADQAFLSANKEEFPERFQTLLLKKNHHPKQIHDNGNATMDTTSLRGKNFRKLLDKKTIFAV